MDKQSIDVIKHWVDTAKKTKDIRFDTFGISDAIITDLLNSSYIIAHNDITGQVSITAHALEDFS
ncbi:MAG: hypothetical protein E7290_09425 [Lachnospiraceae bacterium]|nr:hypothetical protein [Lachnospiraceae bacterium]